MLKIFSENYSDEHRVEIYNEGSSRCFDKSTLIVTNDGSKCISELNKGDSIKTFNETTEEIEYKPINKTLSFINKKPCYKITLKSGAVIKATQDHEFYFEGSWHSLKHIVSLWNESRNINTREED